MTKINEVYLKSKFCYNNDKEKRVVQGKRTKNDETIHKYVEEFFSEV